MNTSGKPKNEARPTGGSNFFLVLYPLNFSMKESLSLIGDIISWLRDRTNNPIIFLDARQ